MIKELVKDDAILSQPCDKATPADEQIARDLVDTLLATEGAACLAANQIGETKAIVAYLDENDEPHIMYNPKLLLGLGAFRAAEGCLTRDEETAVTRYERAKISYHEIVAGEPVLRKEDFHGWTAQMLQHMIDHCKGKLV
ncbi:MAG: peptide deformylase [Slackia sp.]|nr:peptide deformylase [Slackia sp.]